jgi:hypothetical protein
MELEFRQWLEKFDPVMRDVRYGYDFRNRPNPSIPAQVGSDAITGMGNIFRKRMGSAFPHYGSGVGGYFDELSQVFTQDNQFIVVQHVDFAKGGDEATAVNGALQHIQTKPDVIQAAQAYRLDLTKPDKIQKQLDPENNSLKVTFRYVVRMRASQRFQHAPSAD